MDEIEIEDEPRRSKRDRVEKSFGSDFLTYLLKNEPHSYLQVVHCLDDSF